MSNTVATVQTSHLTCPVCRGKVEIRYLVPEKKVDPVLRDHEVTARLGMKLSRKPENCKGSGRPGI